MAFGPEFERERSERYRAGVALRPVAANTETGISGGGTLLGGRGRTRFRAES